MTATAAKPIANLLAKTQALADQRKAENSDQYAKLVRAAAEGRNLDPDEVLEQLEHFDRDPAEFAADVEALAVRFEHKARLDTLPGLERERAGIEQAVEGLNAKLQQAIAKAEAEHAAAVNPLLAKANTLNASIAAAENARNQLRSTCPQDRRDTLTAALRAVAQQSATVTKLEAELTEIQSRQLPYALEQLTASKDAAMKPQILTGVARNLDDAARQERENLSRGVKNAEARVKDLRAAVEKLLNESIPEAKAELEELRAEVNKCEAALLTP
jgi:hypothetical protein